MSDEKKTEGFFSLAKLIAITVSLVAATSAFAGSQAMKMTTEINEENQAGLEDLDNANTQRLEMQQLLQSDYASIRDAERFYNEGVNWLVQAEDRVFFFYQSWDSWNSSMDEFSSTNEAFISYQITFNLEGEDVVTAGDDYAMGLISYEEYNLILYMYTLDYAYLNALMNDNASAYQKQIQEYNRYYNDYDRYFDALYNANISFFHVRNTLNSTNIAMNDYLDANSITDLNKESCRSLLEGAQSAVATYEAALLVPYQLLLQSAEKHFSNSDDLKFKRDKILSAATMFFSGAGVIAGAALAKDDKLIRSLLFSVTGVVYIIGVYIFVTGLYLG